MTELPKTTPNETEITQYIQELREARAKREQALLDRLNEIRRRTNDSTPKSN